MCLKNEFPAEKQHFWPQKRPLWAVGAVKRPAERPKGHLPGNQIYALLLWCILAEEINNFVCFRVSLFDEDETCVGMNPVVLLKHNSCSHKFWSLSFWRWWCRSADVLAGDGDVLAVGGGLGGDVKGMEYLPPRKLCLLISSWNVIIDWAATK